MDEAREIARGLSEAQRRAVLALDGEPRFPTRDTFNGRTAYTMANRLTVGTYDGYFGRDKWSLTPLGLSVRQVLQEEK